VLAGAAPSPGAYTLSGSAVLTAPRVEAFTPRGSRTGKIAATGSSPVPSLSSPVGQPAYSALAPSPRAIAESRRRHEEDRGDGSAPRGAGMAEPMPGPSYDPNGSNAAALAAAEAAVSDAGRRDARNHGGAGHDAGSKALSTPRSRLRRPPASSSSKIPTRIPVSSRGAAAAALAAVNAAGSTMHGLAPSASPAGSGVQRSNNQTQSLVRQHPSHTGQKVGVAAPSPHRYQPPPQAVVPAAHAATLNRWLRTWGVAGAPSAEQIASGNLAALADGTVLVALACALTRAVASGTDKNPRTRAGKVRNVRVALEVLGGDKRVPLQFLGVPELIVEGHVDTVVGLLDDLRATFGEGEALARAGGRRARGRGRAR
jgi:hypothetical protein